MNSGAVNGGQKDDDGNQPSSNLGFAEDQAIFEGPTQNVRVLSEGWYHNFGYCPNCGSGNLKRLENNSPGSDFRCEPCNEFFELKAKKGVFGNRVLDGAFASMKRLLESDSNPNLVLLNYDRERLGVTNLTIIPKHFFVSDLLQERKPLAPSARRAGWIGCNILLSQVPAAGKIGIIRNGIAVPKPQVLQQWERTLFLRKESLSARGWLVDVMRCVDRSGLTEFNLSDVYKFESELSQLYPGNNNVRPKIRQQLQVLRDVGYLEFLGRGIYRLRRVEFLKASP